jgi:hypothetical protein
LFPKTAIYVVLLSDHGNGLLCHTVPLSKIGHSTFFLLWFIGWVTLSGKIRKKPLSYLFLKCNFAKACWGSIGLHVPTGSEKAHAGLQFIQESTREGRWGIDVCWI